MAWVYLLIAGILEIIWAVLLKYAKGFSKFWPSFFVLSIGLASVWLLSIAVKSIPLGTAYAVWTGIGILGTVIFGIVFFQEPFHFLRLFFIFCILAGIIGLRLIS